MGKLESGSLSFVSEGVVCNEILCVPQCFSCRMGMTLGLKEKYSKFTEICQVHMRVNGLIWVQGFQQCWHTVFNKHLPGSSAKHCPARWGYRSTLPVFRRPPPGRRMFVCLSAGHCPMPLLSPLFQMTMGYCFSEDRQPQNRSWLERPKQCRA